MLTVVLAAMSAESLPSYDASHCNHHGAVDDDGACTCAPTFNGPQCQFSDAVQCNGNGEVQYDGIECICADGFDQSAGPSCNVCNANVKHDAEVVTTWILKSTKAIFAASTVIPVNDITGIEIGDSLTISGADAAETKTIIAINENH